MAVAPHHGGRTAGYLLLHPTSPSPETSQKQCIHQKNSCLVASFFFFQTLLRNHR